MKITRKAFCLIVLAVLVIGITGGAFAANVAYQITATVDPTVSISYNGEKQVMTDAKGTQIYPIIFNGSTYLPVRAISNLFSVPVNWDDSTRTVILGSAVKEPFNLTATMGSGNTYCWKINDASDLVVDTETGKTTFETGIVRKIWNGTMSSGKYTLITHNVTGYSTLTFTAWSDINANILVLDAEGGTITSFAINAGALVTKEINIAGYDTIAFGADAQSVGANGTAKIFEPIVK